MEVWSLNFELFLHVLHPYSTAEQQRIDTNDNVNDSEMLA